MNKQAYNSRLDQLKSKLLVSPEFIAASIAALDFNIEEDKLIPQIYDTQRLYIEPILGTALYNKLQENNNTFEYQMLAEDYVWDVLIHRSLAQILSSKGINVANGGIYYHTPTDSLIPENKVIDSLIQKEYNTASDFETRLRDFLQRNEAYYPEYRESALGGISASIKATPQFVGNWYLGDGSECNTTSTVSDDDIFTVVSHWGNNNETDIEFDYTTLSEQDNTLPTLVEAQPVGNYFWVVADVPFSLYQVGVKLPYVGFEDNNANTEIFVRGTLEGRTYYRIKIAETYEAPVSFNLIKD